MAVQDPTRICVQAYNDIDGDGVRDDGEPAMADVTFNLIMPAALQQRVADASGQACFEVPGGGSYPIMETVPAGWMNTDPGAGLGSIIKFVGVETGQTAQIVFGNRQP